jgi:SAM-dependent methyltransferase
MNTFDEYIDDYEAACESGLRLAGETRDYYARQRVEFTRALCPTPNDIHTIIDFGCGLGHTTPHLLAGFRRASIIGIDNGPAVIQAAHRHYASSRAQFTCDADSSHGRADLVYCNGVFHHIPRADRKRVVSKIFGWLRCGGLFAFWENNPWNIGTRLVMSRIPFDRDAEPLSYREARDLLALEGFRILGTTFHFFFPAQLKALRRFEPRLRGLPLGGQYCVLAERVDGPL